MIRIRNYLDWTRKGPGLELNIIVDCHYMHAFKGCFCFVFPLTSFQLHAHFFKVCLYIFTPFGPIFLCYVYKLFFNLLSNSLSFRLSAEKEFQKHSCLNPILN